uniref:Uncharacterized protein n=1 Tax=Arundo donax TaxID=35708 RepID=A0A0A9DQC5_ARUDO
MPVGNLDGPLGCTFHMTFKRQDLDIDHTLSKM